MSIADFIITGDKALFKKLHTLEKKVGMSIVRKGVRAGANVVLKKAKANAMSEVGGEMGRLIKKYLKVKVWEKQPPGAYGMGVVISEAGNDVFVVTSRAGRRNYIPHALEYGHALPGGGGAKSKGREGYGGGGGAKAVAAIPFMRPAYETEKDKAKRVIEQTMWAEIAKVAKA